MLGEFERFLGAISNYSHVLAEFPLFISLALALILDHFLGEAKRYHHLVGFGHLASALEQKLNLDIKQAPKKIRFSKQNAFRGALAWFLLVLPLPIIYLAIEYYFVISWYWLILIDAFILHLAIGLNSLNQHAMQVYKPLKGGDLKQARHYTGYLVSRDTKTLDSQAMSRATVESMLENGHDAVIASLVCYLIGGIPLVIIHRLANTLDAMWGYRNARFTSFGYAPARLDDVLGFISAKCSSILYALQGNFILALNHAYKQGNQYKSHNGGWVMAAGASVMKRSLGGHALYHGHSVNSPVLGQGKAVDVNDIPRSVMLVRRAALILLVAVFGAQVISYLT